MVRDYLRQINLLKGQNEQLNQVNKSLQEKIQNLTNIKNIINIDFLGKKNFSKNIDGVYIYNGEYGAILKFCINLRRFIQNNKVSQKGNVYFEVRESSNGHYYATPQKYY